MSIIEQKKRTLKQLAILFANDEKIKTYLLKRDRTSLQKYILYLLNELKEKGEDYSFTVNFHVPPATVFLSSLAVNKYGEDLSDSRQMITMVNQKHSLLSGFEADAIDLRLRAVVPISKVTSSCEVEWIGSVETAVDFRQLLEEYPFETNKGVIVFLTPSKKAVFNAKKDKKIGLKEPYITDFHLPLDFYSFLAEHAPENGIIEKGGYVFLSYPLKDFRGVKIGKVLLGVNLSSFLYSRNQILLILSFMFLSAFIVTSFAIWGGLDRIVKNIKDFKESIVALSKGDFSKPVPLPARIFCWEFLGCTNKECPVYHNESKICFLETGDFALFPQHRGTCMFLSKYGSCKNCPVMAMKTKNEVCELACWYNTILGGLGRFFSSVNLKLSEILGQPKVEESESLILRVEMVINELMELTRFRKIMETFLEKEEVYQYFRWILKNHFDINNF
ncbi:MAG: hypothetical protein J7M03_03670, partial [Candidatus Desulfofervidaceae bacterium]|nr:hypothetical protein [Candidatus Desulfofervidaceae bacterium]